MKYLSYDEFMENADRNLKLDDDGNPIGHWLPEKLQKRWNYHALAIEVIRHSDTENPQKVLEMGTMGAQLVHDSHTIDYAGNWSFEGFNPTYLHDARSLPWPIEDKQYEWFVALRVFHHLWPLQRECFAEARRVAENVLIVVPSRVPEGVLRSEPRTDAGITPLQFLSWNEGSPPQLWKPLKGGSADLYWWSDATHSDSLSPKSRLIYSAKASAVESWRKTKLFVQSKQSRA